MPHHDGNIINNMMCGHVRAWFGYHQFTVMLIRKMVDSHWLTNWFRVTLWQTWQIRETVRTIDAMFPSPMFRWDWSTDNSACLHWGSKFCEQAIHIWIRKWKLRYFARSQMHYGFVGRFCVLPFGELKDSNIWPTCSSEILPANAWIECILIMGVYFQKNNFPQVNLQTWKDVQSKPNKGWSTTSNPKTLHTVVV